jgi:hypothetical protein
MKFQALIPDKGDVLLFIGQVRFRCQNRWTGTAQTLRWEGGIRVVEHRISGSPSCGWSGVAAMTAASWASQAVGRSHLGCSAARGWGLRDCAS